MTYERNETEAMLRQLARSQLHLLTATVAQLTATMDLPERLELSVWVGEGRRLLHGDEAAPAATMPPPNVRRLVAVGRSGPAFGARSGSEAAIGQGGLRARYEGTSAAAFEAATDRGPGESR